MASPDESEVWGLHSALAWVVTRDLDFTRRIQPNWLRPDISLPSDPQWPSGLDQDVAWRSLHTACTTTAQPALSLLGCIGSGRAPEAIPATLLRHCDWAYSADRSEAFLTMCCAVGPIVQIRQVRFSADELTQWFPASGQVLTPAMRWEGAPPSDAGYIPLFEAAAWIATCGGQRPVFPDDLGYWEIACADVVREVAKGRLSLIGRASGSPLSSVIDGLALLWHFTSEARPALWTSECVRLEDLIQDGLPDCR